MSTCSRRSFACRPLVINLLNRRDLLNRAPSRCRSFKVAVLSLALALAAAVAPPARSRGGNQAATKKSAGSGPASPAHESNKTQAKPWNDDRFSALADSFFSDWFKFHPGSATQDGFHDHDAELEDFSQSTFKSQVSMLESYLARFEAVDKTALSRNQQVDRLLLINFAKGKLFELQERDTWHSNPDHYTTVVSSSIFNLVKRDFAPLSERLKSVVAREEQIPKVLDQAKHNLNVDAVPQIFVEVALEQLDGTVSFFEESVPEAFASVQDTALHERLEKSTKATVAALKDYRQFLRKDLLETGCKGSFALGESKFKKKLALDEMVDEPIDVLLSHGEAELRRLQGEFAQVAKRMHPDQAPEVTFQQLSADHPQPDQLLADIRNVLERIRTFCVERKIVTIPGEERPLVEESPPFERALTFASLDVPGAFEKRATESYYHVTLPDPKWPAARTEEHMRTFSYPDLLNTSVHETYPGHFVQYLFCKSAPTKTRKLIGCSSNDEGWAHYCEQMMVDEGFAGGDDKLRLVQIHDALLRACRYMVGVRMHTRSMTIKQGTEFFMKEGFQEKANAEREAKRGTMDPTYMVYTLGKLEILKLRDDYKALRGSSYSLLDFHDRFLSLGFPPLKLVRAMLLDQPIPPG